MMADGAILTRLDGHDNQLERHDEQLAQLARLVARLHEVAERHNAAIEALEVALARVGRAWPGGGVP